MNWDQFEGSLKQLQGELTERFGKLIGSEEDECEGWLQKKEGMVQAHFGSIREEVEERYEELHMV